MLLRKDNAIVEESNKDMIKELKLNGYEEITKEDLKPKESKKASSK